MKPLVHSLRQILTALLGLLLVPASAGEWIRNGGFEEQLTGWSAFWTREPDAGRLTLDTNRFHTGIASARIEHRGAQDWSFSSSARLIVQPGDICELAGWLRTGGEHRATLCVTAYDAAGKVVDWAFGEASVIGGDGWQRAAARFVIPGTVREIQPRLIGNGPITVWLDDVSLRKEGSLADLRGKGVPSSLVMSNPALVVTLNTAALTLAVQDRRTGQTWAQKENGRDLVLQDVRADRGWRLKLLHVGTGQNLECTVQMDGLKPEFTVELTAAIPLPKPLQFPHPFVSDAGTDLIVPMNEGISYPVGDTSVDPMRLVAYGGHGICMAFWGVSDGERGQMAIIETPDDAAIRIARDGGQLFIAPEWDAQHGQFGYARKLRYVFFDHGGHVAMCKRYREYAQKLGRLKTLAQKRAENPNVDLLVGAVNVWCWDRDAVAIVRELQAAGIDRILWSNQQSPTNLARLNELGVLTSRYDIYQDVMNPENFPRLRWQHPDWTTKAWPGDIITNASGQFLKGWGVEARDGAMIPCGVICDRRALDYARERIPADLATHAYRCRFIDTTTAAPWNECYGAAHLMTRTESREWKMKLLQYVSEDQKLVTGCETGHDAAVPFLHYFEGMLSLGPYRVPDSGRDMQRLWDEVPARVAQFQLGHRYRLPLWELVYHDCVVAQWYWGDYNNKLPALWDKRDLFNALYGTPPMFMFTRDRWRQNQGRFVQSYRNTGPVARATGYSEMTSHRYLTPDRDVQQTQFANGTRVVVNFGERSFRLPDGTELAGMGFRISASDQPPTASR